MGIFKFFFPYLSWLKLRKESEDEHGHKLCYCGHTHLCECSDPDRELFYDSVKRGTIIPGDKNNGWKKIEDSAS